MFLKINLGNKIKKVMYPDGIDSYVKFKNFVSDVLKRPHDTFTVYFYDNDNEKFKLDDDHDLEYFNEYSKTQKSKEIFVQIDDSDFLEMSFQQISDINAEKNNPENLKIKELSKKCENQEQFINDLNSEKQILEEKIFNLKENNLKIIEEYTNQIAENKTEFETINLQRANIIESLTQELNSLKVLQNQKETDTQKLQEQLLFLENKFLDQQTTQQKKEKVFEQTKAKMILDQEELQKIICEHKFKSENLSEELQALKEENFQSQDMLKQKELSNVNLSKEVEQLKTKLSERDQQIQTNESYIDNQLTLIEELKQKIQTQDEKIEQQNKEIEQVKSDKQKDIENQKQYIQFQDDQIKILEKKIDYVNKNDLNNSQLIPQKKEQNICNMLEESNLSIFDQNYVQKEEVNKLNESFQQMQDQLSFFMNQMQQGEQRKQSLNSSVINSGVKCSECAKENFTGKRYLCMYCEDFNICAECEHKNNHPHLMIRIHGNENDTLLEYVIKKIKNFQDKKNNKKCKKDKKKKKNEKKEQQEFESKSKLIEFVYGVSQNEAQSTIRKQFITKHLDCELEQFHKMIVNNKKIFEQIN